MSEIICSGYSTIHPHSTTTWTTLAHMKMSLSSNEMFQDCCYSKINQLIQCVNRLSKHHPEIYKDYFEGPMVGVKSMRVWFIHRYERTEPSLVWYFLVNDLPNIENAARDALYRLSFDETKKSASLNLKPKRSLFGRKNNQR